MQNTARQTRENRTITVDFQNEATYFPLLVDGKAFVECVMAFILSLGFQLKHKESAKYRGAPLRHGPDRATLPAWNLHMKHSISTNCALC